MSEETLPARELPHNETGYLCFSERLKLGEQIDVWMVVNGVKKNAQGVLCGLMALGYRVLGSGMLAPQTPVDARREQESGVGGAMKETKTEDYE